MQAVAMRRENLSEAVEDYLKTIYELSANDRRASTNQIAQALGVTPASVSGMLKKLSETQPPMLQYQKHRGVTLTGEGEMVALEILRHHRLLEMYLHQVLGYDWDQVHREACRLEHVISEDFETRIDRALGHPSHDPHGDPIPTQDLDMPDSPSLQLFMAEPGQHALIRRVGSEDPDFLRYLGSLALIPQARLKIMDRSPFDENMRIQLEGSLESLVLGPNITRQIFIDIL